MPQNVIRRSAFQVRKRAMCLPMIDVYDTRWNYKSYSHIIHDSMKVCDDLRKGSFSPDG